MNVFRRMSTARLLALIGVVAAMAIVAGIAVARSGAGPRPPRRPLAVAVHRALTAKPVAGLSARITFTNHLFPSGSLPGVAGSALLNGASGRLWVSSDGRFRLELQSDAGDTQIMGGGGSLRLYDAASNQVYVLPSAHGATSAQRPQTRQHVPSVGEITRALRRLSAAADVSGAVPGDIAGRPVYSVRISPRHDGGLLGGLQLAWDAQHGVPLKVAIYSRGNSSPVLALTATQVHYGPVAASDLTVHPPSTAKVTTITLPSSTSPKRDAHGTPVTGLSAVRAKLPFALSAPASVAGLPRQTVRLVDAHGHTAALVVYGRGLGAVAVLEQASGSSSSHSNALGSLPRVSINGATGQELATALGTLLRFERGGVTYTLVGSVPAVAAEAAARAL